MKWTEYDPTKVPATRSDIHNFPNKKVTGKKHYDSAVVTGNNNAVAIKAYNIAKDAGFTDDQAYEYVYDAVTHANKTLWNPEVKTNDAYRISSEHIPPYQESYMPIDHGEITKSVDKYATEPIKLESYEQKIAKGWKSLKNNNPEISLAVDVGSVVFRPLSIFDAGMAVDNIKNPNVENDIGDYLDLLGFIPIGKVSKRLATAQATRATNELADLARRKYISNIKRKKLESGIKNNVTVVNSLPYFVLETPNYISDIKDVVDKYKEKESNSKDMQEQYKNGGGNMRVRVYNKRKTTQDLINEERERLDSDFNARLKNAEESMKAIYPEEYKKIRSRYFGNGNNLGLIGSQYNYIHDMITRRSDDQMKKYYNELNDYFIKQTGTQPGYMLPDVDVNGEYNPQGKIRDLTVVTPNSDYLNTVSANNAKQSVYNSDASAFNTGYEERLRDENPTAYDTWERAQNSPVVTAMEFSPLFPVVAGVKSVAAANAPQASAGDVAMNAAFAAIPAGAKAKDLVNVARKLLWNKMPQIPISRRLKTATNNYVGNIEEPLDLSHHRFKINDLELLPEVKIGVDKTGNFYKYRINDDVYMVNKNTGDVSFMQDRLKNDFGELSLFKSNPEMYTIKMTSPYADAIDLEEDSRKLLSKIVDKNKVKRFSKNIGSLLPSGSKVSADFEGGVDRVGLSMDSFEWMTNQPKYGKAKLIADESNKFHIWNDQTFKNRELYDLYTKYANNKTIENLEKYKGALDKFLTEHNMPISTVDKNGNVLISQPILEYDNGGVLDATYKEQINRIRQPRFAGWRFKDGGIYIKKENRGKFTEQAQRAGMTTKQFTSEVLENPNKYSPTTVKRARFSRNIGGN